MCKVVYWISVVTRNPSKALTLRPTAFYDHTSSHCYFLIKFAKQWWACWVGSGWGEVGGASVCRDMKLISVVLVWWCKTSYSTKSHTCTSLVSKSILLVSVVRPNPCNPSNSSSAHIQMTSMLRCRDVMDHLPNAALFRSDMWLKTLYLSENHFLCIIRPDVLTVQASTPNREQLSENNLTRRGGKEQRKQDFVSNFVKRRSVYVAE